MKQEDRKGSIDANEKIVLCAGDNARSLHLLQAEIHISVPGTFSALVPKSKPLSGDLCEGSKGEKGSRSLQRPSRRSIRAASAKKI